MSDRGRIPLRFALVALGGLLGRLRYSGLRLAGSFGLALSAPGAAMGQDAAKIFAKPAEYQGATLSPTGAYVAVTTPFEERRALTIIKLSGVGTGHARLEAALPTGGTTHVIVDVSGYFD